MRYYINTYIFVKSKNHPIRESRMFVTLPNKRASSTQTVELIIEYLPNTHKIDHLYYHLHTPFPFLYVNIISHTFHSTFIIYSRYVFSTIKS